MPNVPAIQCKALSKQTGKQCKRKAIPGGEVCHWHGGAAKQVKARAGVRAEVMAWGLGDSHVDPGELRGSEGRGCVRDGRGDPGSG
jgi:hypothetical protein